MKKVCFIFFLSCFSFVSFAYAADAIAVKSFDFNALWKGAVMGAIAALVGWLKDKDFKLADFELPEALQRVFWGLVVGIVAAWKGVDFTTASAWATGIGLAVLFQEAWKVAWRRLFKPHLPVINPTIPK